MLLKNNYICAVDIGSTKVCAVVVEIKNKHISQMFCDSMPTKSLRKGVVVDSLELVGVVGRLLRNLREKSGIKIKFVYTNISGQDIITKHSRAIIPLAERGNKVINRYDVARANEQARILGSSLEEEVIHQIPFNYAIDSNQAIANPIGLYSHKLETDLYLICAKLASVQSVARVINQSGYEIRNLFFSGLATSSAVLDNDTKLGTDIFCDIGGDVTELLFFKNGTLANIEILDIGGDDLTAELSETLKIPPELAEDVKRSYAVASDSDGENKEILIKKDNAYKPIKQKIVADVITAKTQSMCRIIKDRMDKIVDYPEVDSFVASGRAILLEGFLEALEITLGVPVKLARITDQKIITAVSKDSMLSGQKYLNYLTALGIISYCLRREHPLAASGQQDSPNIWLKLANKVEEIYQEYF